MKEILKDKGSVYCNSGAWNAFNKERQWVFSLPIDARQNAKNIFISGGGAIREKNSNNS